MYMPDYEYHAPGSLAEASALLVDLGEKAMVLAGGSDVLHKLKIGAITPEHLVSLKNMKELREIRYEQGRGIVIGALVTHDGIYRSKLLQERFLSLPMAAHTMANTQITNIGTVGGNIANGSPLADLPPILIALNASVKLVSGKGERVMALEDFILGPGKTALDKGNGEILTEIVIPDQGATGSTYSKFGLRKSGSLAVVGVAVSVTVKNGVIEDSRIVMGAVAPTPLRAKAAEAYLVGKKPTDEVIEEAAATAAGESRPISDLRGSAEYRRELVRVLTKRTLRKAIDEGHV